MEWLIAVIIGGVLLVSDFFGGFATGYNASEKAKPTTNVQNSYQTTYVDTRSESRQQAIQITYTVIAPGVTNMVISFRDITNTVALTNYMITNFSAKTNIR